MLLLWREFMACLNLVFCVYRCTVMQHTAYSYELLHWERRTKPFSDKGAAGVGMHEACVPRWKVKWMLGAKRAMWVCNELTFDPPLLLSFLWQLPPFCLEKRWLILAFVRRPFQSESRRCQLFISDLLVQLASADCRAAGVTETSRYVSPGTEDVLASSSCNNRTSSAALCCEEWLRSKWAV